MSLKVSKAQTKLARQALSSKEFTSARILKYGLAALVGLISGFLVVRARSETTCEWCEADYAAIVTDYMSLACEELDTRQLEDEVIHPWRYAEDREEE